VIVGLRIGEDITNLLKTANMSSSRSCKSLSGPFIGSSVGSEVAPLAWSSVLLWDRFRFVMDVDDVEELRDGGVKVPLAVAMLMRDSYCCRFLAMQQMCNALWVSKSLTLHWVTSASRRKSLLSELLGREEVESCSRGPTT